MLWHGLLAGHFDVCDIFKGKVVGRLGLTFTLHAAKDQSDKHEERSKATADQLHAAKGGHQMRDEPFKARSGQAPGKHLASNQATIQEAEGAQSAQREGEQAQHAQHEAAPPLDQAQSDDSGDTTTVLATAPYAVSGLLPFFWCCGVH